MLLSQLRPLKLMRKLLLMVTLKLRLLLQPRPRRLRRL